MDATAIGAARRWYWQRATAMLMLLFVIIHIALIIYAMAGGLSAAEILARTRDSVAWAAFYTVFVLLLAVHACIGARAILVEWCRLRERQAALVANLFGLLLLFLGCRAVWAVTFGVGT